MAPNFLISVLLKINFSIDVANDSGSLGSTKKPLKLFLQISLQPGTFVEIKEVYNLLPPINPLVNLHDMMVKLIFWTFEEKELHFQLLVST